MVQQLILQGGQEIPFHINIYNANVSDHVDGVVVNDVLTRGWLGATAINLWIRYSSIIVIIIYQSILFCVNDIFCLI